MAEDDFVSCENSLSPPSEKLNGRARPVLQVVEQSAVRCACSRPFWLHQALLEQHASTAAVLRRKTPDTLPKPTDTLSSTLARLRRKAAAVAATPPASTATPTYLPVSTFKSASSPGLKAAATTTSAQGLLCGDKAEAHNGVVAVKSSPCRVKVASGAASVRVARSSAATPYASSAPWFIEKARGGTSKLDSVTHAIRKRPQSRLGQLAVRRAPRRETFQSTSDDGEASYSDTSMSDSHRRNGELPSQKHAARMRAVDDKGLSLQPNNNSVVGSSGIVQCEVNSTEAAPVRHRNNARNRPKKKADAVATAVDKVLPSLESSAAFDRPWTPTDHEALQAAIAKASLSQLQGCGTALWEQVSIMLQRTPQECAREASRLEEEKVDAKRAKKIIDRGGAAASLEQLRARIPSKGNARQWRVNQFMKKAVFHREKPQNVLNIRTTQGSGESCNAKTHASNSGRRCSTTPLFSTSRLAALQNFSTGLTPRPSTVPDAPAVANGTARKVQLYEIAPDARLSTAADLVTTAEPSTRSIAEQRFVDRHRKKLLEIKKSGSRGAPPLSIAEPGQRYNCKVRVDSLLRVNNRKRCEWEKQDYVRQLRQARNYSSPSDLLEQQAIEAEFAALSLSEDEEDNL